MQRPHPVRVAVDGCSAAGKTTFSDELADVVRQQTDRAVVRVGIDYFKRAVALRTAYPADSPESYYLDSGTTAPSATSCWCRSAPAAAATTARR